ncbi:MAG: hypothetical protein AB7F59_08675, partial [Bdellovibrionales bacterium]
MGFFKYIFIFFVTSLTLSFDVLASNPFKSIQGTKFETSPQQVMTPQGPVTQHMEIEVYPVADVHDLDAIQMIVELETQKARAQNPNVAIQGITIEKEGEKSDAAEVQELRKLGQTHNFSTDKIALPTNWTEPFYSTKIGQRSIEQPLK